MKPQRLAQLVDAHAAALALYARQWCSAPEDIVQEAFVKLAAQKAEPDNVAAWLHKVVRNAALSAARGDRRRRHHEAAAAGRNCDWFVPAEGTGLDAEAAAQALLDGQAPRAAAPLGQRGRQLLEARLHALEPRARALLS